MKTLHMLLLLVIIALLGVLGIIRSIERFADDEDDDYYDDEGFKVKGKKNKKPCNCSKRCQKLAKIKCKKM